MYPSPFFGRSVVALAIGLCLSAPAFAQAAKPKSAAAPATAPGGHQALLLGTFGDWGAYTTQASGRSRICYALSQPKDRQPASLSRDPGYLFVSFRPAENVRGEVAAVVGFPTNDGAAEATVDGTVIAFITKGANAWVKNPAEEGQVVAAMQKGSSLSLKATSKRGNASTDRYSLSGFSAALERARKECQ